METGGSGLRDHDGVWGPWSRAALSHPVLLDSNGHCLVVVFFELWAIAWIQNRYMETPFLRAAFQVVFGGGLVLAAGILIGGA